MDNDPVCTSLSVTVPANVPTVLPDLPCIGRRRRLDHGVRRRRGARDEVDLRQRHHLHTGAGYSGPDSLAFWAEDEFFASEDATLNITVRAGLPAAAASHGRRRRRRPTPKDTTAPAIALKNASKKQAVAIALTTNENASATLTLTLDKATAKKLKLSRSVGTLKAAVTPGTSTLKVKLSSKAAKAFKKLKRGQADR